MPLSAQTIEGPDQDRVELPAVGAGENLSKGSPVAPRAAGRVGVYAGHLQAETVGPVPELGLLGLGGLLAG
jgi:hypothetical protein